MDYVMVLLEGIEPSYSHSLGGRLYHLSYSNSNSPGDHKCMANFLGPI